MRAVAAVVVMSLGVLAVIAGCAASKPERLPEFSAQRLGEPSSSVWLSPEERAALDRAGITPGVDDFGAEPSDDTGADDAGFPDRSSKSDKATQAMLSILGVSVTLGMAVAPFLLY